MTAAELREEMRRRGLSQAELGRRARIAQSIVSDWLNGKREPSEFAKKRVAEALARESGDNARAGAPEDELYATDEDAAAAEIMDALGMAASGEAESDSEPEHEPRPEPRPEPVPARPDAAELIYELTRIEGAYIFDGIEGEMCVSLPGHGALARFAENLMRLDGMLRRGDIDADAHRIAAASLAGRWNREEADGNA